MMQRLLDRLLAARARRDREVRFTDAWRAADTEMHEIERAIFRVPMDAAQESVGVVAPDGDLGVAPQHLHAAASDARRRAEGYAQPEPDWSDAERAG
jgi:hypothetical protein